MILVIMIEISYIYLGGERGRAVKALDSGFRVRDQLTPAGSLCPWARHFTLIVPWFGGHVKPSVPSEVLSTHFGM